MIRQSKTERRSRRMYWCGRIGSSSKAKVKRKEKTWNVESMVVASITNGRRFAAAVEFPNRLHSWSTL